MKVVTSSVRSRLEANTGRSCSSCKRDMKSKLRVLYKLKRAASANDLDT